MSNFLIITITIIAYAFGSFFYKSANNLLHPVMISTIAVGLYILLLPIAWSFIKFDHTLNVTGFVYALIGSFCLCVGTLGFSYALRAGGAAGQTTFIISLYPSLTLILSIIFLKEDLSWTKVIGCLFALISIFFLSR